MIILRDINETKKWAREFARGLRAPVTVALHGDLGMGKSEIARAIIHELCGADTIVPSPTFTIVQGYKCMTPHPSSQSDDTRPPSGAGESGISHFDLYRITDASELEEIGLPHAIANDITLIEWPEIATHILPRDTIHIYIEQYGDGRELTLK